MVSPPVYDVAVIGGGPAGAQAAVSAAHQMRHVLVLDAGGVSHRKGRAFWSKSVEIQDAPVFAGITGPKLVAALRTWMAAQPVRRVTIAQRERTVGIHRQPAYVRRVRRIAPPAGENAPAGYLFEIDASTAPLPFVPAHTRATGQSGVNRTDDRGGRKDAPTSTFRARTLVVASGFEDNWPDIDVDESATRLYKRHHVLFRFAGNRRGWHVCIRCDGHLHVDEHLAIVATGDVAWDTARGAQDFTDKITVLTNGRPLDLSPERRAVFRARGIEVETERIVAHVGKGIELLGLRLAGGRELYFDGFVVDEGLTPNTGYLRPEDGWSIKTDEDGLVYVDEDGQVLTPAGDAIPGLFAAGDIVAGQRNLIATAFALGQNAGLSASDLMREW